MIEPIERKELKGINKATEQLHVAIQYLSMVGEFLTDPKTDPGDNNIGWLIMKEKFISLPFGENQEYALELSPELMQLTLADIANKTEAILQLKGRTQDEGFKWLKDQLKKNKIQGAKKYQLRLPYELPAYANFEGKKFKRSPRRTFIGFSKLRTWAQYFVNKHKINFESASPTKTWPHHFDHASFIPLEKSKNGEATKSISLGLAIHDGMIDEPYFYISVWQKEKELDLSTMKELSSGYWLNEGFKGAVLPVLDLVDDLNFEKRIDSYFKEAIEQLLNLVKYKRKTVNGK